MEKGDNRFLGNFEAACPVTPACSIGISSRMKTPIRYGRVSSAMSILALAIIGAGCGKSPAARLPVYGAVSYANGETFNGSITFVPANGRPGPAATTGVSNGYYRFDSTNGPTAGPHRVMIRQIIPRGAALKSLGQRKPPAAPGSADAGSGKTAWTLSADVPLDGPYQFDFKLDP
jgi:hypothetical protein